MDWVLYDRDLRHQRVKHIFNILKTKGYCVFHLHMQRCEPQKIYEEMPLLKNLLPEQLRIYSVIKSQFDQGSFISTQL